MAHTFRVDSPTARMLVLSTPAGLEDFYRACAVPATAATLPPPDTPRPAPGRLRAIFAEHRVLDVGPPLGPGD